MKLLEHPRARPLALLAGALLLLAFLFTLRAPPPSPDPLPRPAAGNAVDPAFHDRLGALEARLASDPANVDLRLTVARLLHDAHRHAAAAEHFERFLEQRPDDRQAWLDLANVYAAAGQWAEAERASRALLEILPEDVSARYNMGAIAANTARFDEAKNWWAMVAEQRTDVQLQAQAIASLQQLDALQDGASGGAPPLRPGQRELPPGHPPLDGVTATNRAGDALDRFVVARPVKMPG